jgi:hypothetical protein
VRNQKYTSGLPVNGIGMTRMLLKICIHSSESAACRMGTEWVMGKSAGELLAKAEESN